MHLKTDTGANAHYATVPKITHSRNAFSIAEKLVTTMQFDKLYPVWHKFIYPGDTLSVTQHQLARLQTQACVLFDDLYVDIHAWYVPFRLIQTNWARYQFNAQPAGPTQDNSALHAPIVALQTDYGSGPDGNIFKSKSLYDYFGYPTESNWSSWTSTGGKPAPNNYLARAYNLIWNENYRDQNLQNPRVVDLDEGPDDVIDYYQLAPRGKRHDVFTSGLPFQQKGPLPLIPLGQNAPVFRTSNAPRWLTYAAGSNTLATPSALYAGAGSQTEVVAGAVSFDPANGSTVTSGLYALLTGLGPTVNQLRTTIAVQQLLEGDARGGTRDVESLNHRWGVTVPDFRLQRPEYIGGTTWSFDGNIVPQTSATGTTPQANLVQFSQALSAFNINHSFVEHGVFMILASARSNQTYQQFLQKELTYYSRFDWYQPEFANLGEVAQYVYEMWVNQTSAGANGMGVLNYQEYGYELRYGLNRVTGEMRSNYATSLDSRHMAYDFDPIVPPVFNGAFIENYTPIDRNIVVSSAVADPIELNQLIQGKIVRTLPMYSVPGLTRL